MRGGWSQADRRGLPCAALALVLALAACGTIDSRRAPDLETSRIYSGAKRDLDGMRIGLMGLRPAFVLLYLIDLPLSLLADTALLPLSIPEDAERRVTLAEALQTDRDVKSVIPVRPDAPRLENARRLLAECERRFARLDPFVANCYAVDARIVRGDGSVTDGGAFKRALRHALREAQGDVHFVRYAEPVFELEDDGENVRIRAIRTSSFEGKRTPTTLRVGPGPDDGWRILEETEVGWPAD